MSPPRVLHLLAAMVVAFAAALSVAVAFGATNLIAALDVVDAALLGLGFALSALAAIVGAPVVTGAFPDRLSVCPAEPRRIDQGRHVS